MSVQVRRRREAASFLATFVGAQGELLVDTTDNRVQVHDGATPGGWPAARLADLPSTASPLALAQGGTGMSAASPGALLAALGAIGRTTVADAAYAATGGDRTIAFASLTAPRTVTLPAASAYPPGVALTVFDESGACSAANAITVACAGSDTVNGAGSVAVASAYGYLALESNGSAKWTVVDAVAAAAAAGSGGALAVSGGGTGAATAAGARGNLGAAAAGSNADITALANLSGILDAAAGSARGSLLYRGAAGWTALAPGTSGNVLTSNGAGSAPSYQAAAGGGGASAPCASVRQTVQGGPLAGGTPSFLPATAASLSITGQNVSATTPLTVTAAQGFGSAGQVDRVCQLAANPSWSGLTSGATNYLFVDAASGATSSSTLQPVEQFGGAASTANGQFTFDIAAMRGYLGNGSAAVAASLVCVGEAVTSASAVTATVAYAYNGLYRSPNIASPNTGTVTFNFNSNLGTSKFVATYECVLTAAKGDYSAGDVLPLYTVKGGTVLPLAVNASRNTVGILTADSAVYYYYPKTTNGGSSQINGNEGGFTLTLVQRRSF